MRLQKPDREAAAARREKHTGVGYTPYARLAKSEACNCAYSWASSIWYCDIARIPEAFHARPDGERTAAALLPFREACGYREDDSRLSRGMSLRVLQGGCRWCRLGASTGRR
jgi:hypothetical protein